MPQRLVRVAVLTAAASVGAAAQTSVAPQIVLPPPTGSDSFEYFCANCHGSEGRGNGPLRTELRTPPADLTGLTKRNGGEFPREYVQELLTHDRVGTPAHGTSDMPIWGTIFRGLEPSDRQAQTRIDAVIAFLQSIQD